MHYHAWDMSQGCLGVNGPEITFFFHFFYMHTLEHTHPFLSKLLPNTYSYSQDPQSDIYS